MIASSSLHLSKGLHLGNSKKLFTSVFRTRGGSVNTNSRLNLSVTATSTITNTVDNVDTPVPIDITAERLEHLRREMKKDGLDCFIVPTEDPHLSEYTAPYYYRREYITGFTGKNN